MGVKDYGTKKFTGLWNKENTQSRK